MTDHFTGEHIAGEHAEGDSIGSNLLASRWDKIHQIKNQIAEELDIKSEGIGGTLSKQVMAVCEFLRGPARYEGVISRPEVLAICNPLLDLPDDHQITQHDIARATHEGLCTLARHGSATASLSRMLLYPFFLSVVTVFAAIFFSFYVIESFEEMYTEFGIALPRVTNLVLGTARLVRNYTVAIVLLTTGIPAFFYCLNWIGHKNREAGQSWLDVKLARKRTLAARFLFHVSLLLESGLPQPLAIETASAASGRNWLRRRAKRGRSNQQQVASFFGGRKFAVADNALLAEPVLVKIRLLRQVATWYRDSTSGISHWWIELFVAVYVWLMVAAIVIAVFSLFAPLFAIVGGLTGGGMPGGMM